MQRKIKMYKCEYFGIKELVSPNVYKSRGEKSWQLFDERLLKVADLLREHFGQCVVNDWSWGGSFKNSGLRSRFSKWFKPFSQHTFGRALDMKFTDIEAFKIRENLRLNWDSKWSFLFKEIGIESITLECGEKITWLHIDIRNNSKGANIFTV